MRISKRGWLVLGTLSALLVVLAAFLNPWLKAAQTVQPRRGQLSETSLGNLLAAMGLKPTKVEKRYDFAFKAVHKEEEWDLSMSSVLSEDGQSIWVMAWLDELPRSAVDVPRTALLRLLANNDRLGNGKFFAYIASNRRFVLQRVVANQEISTAGFRDILQDLGRSVVETHPHWSVANWKRKTTTGTASATNDGASTRQTLQPANNRVPATATPKRTTTRSSRFRLPIRR